MGLDHQDDWTRLERFVEYTRELAQHSRHRSPGGHRFSIITDDAGTRFEADQMPSDEAIESLMVRLRPFVLQGESTYFFAIVNILSRRLKSEAFRAYFETQKALFIGTVWQPFKLVAEASAGTSNAKPHIVNSPETLDLWLNGFIYHRDDEKRQLFKALMRGDAPIEAFSRATFIEMMLMKARAVLDISNAVYVLREGQVMRPFPLKWRARAVRKSTDCPEQSE